MTGCRVRLRCAERREWGVLNFWASKFAQRFPQPGSLWGGAGMTKALRVPDYLGHILKASSVLTNDNRPLSALSQTSKIPLNLSKLKGLP